MWDWFTDKEASLGDVLKALYLCFKTLYHKQRWLSSCQSHLIPDHLPQFPSLASTGSLARWLPLWTCNQQPWMKGTFHPRSVKPLLTWPGDGSHRPADTSESESPRPEQETPLTPEALTITAVRISIFPFPPHPPTVVSLELWVGSFPKYLGL